MKFCYKCGTQLNDEDKFCYKCGTKLAVSNGEENVNKDVPLSQASESINSNTPEPEVVCNTVVDNDESYYQCPELNGTIAKTVKVIALIAGGLLVFQGVIDLISTVFGIIGSMFSYGIIDGIIGNVIFIVPYFLSCIGLLLSATLYIVYGMKRTSANSSSLFLVLVVANVINTIAQCLVLILNLDRNAGSYLILTWVFCLILFVLLYVNGDITVLAFDYSGGFDVIIEQVKNDFTDAFADLNGQFNNFKDEKINDYKKNQAEKEAKELERAKNAPVVSLNKIEGVNSNSSVTVGTRIIKTNRNIFMIFLLSLLTCGLYYYWLVYTVAQDVNEICADDDEKTGGLLAFILLSFLTCGFYTIYWEYKIANRLQNYAPRLGITLSENGTSVLMWYLIGLFICGLGPYIALNVVIANLNRLAKVYNKLVLANSSLEA